MLQFYFLCVFLAFQAIIWAGITVTELKEEIQAFTSQEIAAHFAEIKSFDPPPNKVFGALTTGKYSWGSFMCALASQADPMHARPLAEMGLIEARCGSIAFSQLYAALALRHFGTDLKHNGIWKTLSPEEKQEWRAFLHPGRFYNRKLMQVVDLAENYLGVAARLAAVSDQMGILKDRQLLDGLIERAAQQFLEGAFYADDSPPTGRFDRYSNELARFCWDAAEIAGRKDILEKLRPSLKQQMRLWGDLVSKKGYGYNWGRTQGLISYLDTMEICAFLGDYPEFRPFSIGQIASIYLAAWRSVEKEYDRDRHLFRVFGKGKGHYEYITRSREWQQTTAAFNKLVWTGRALMPILEKENVDLISAKPQFDPVARFEFFEKKAGKQSGIWLVRQKNFAFTLPISTGPKPGIADYLPAPCGLPGLAAPVGEVYPALVPFLTLSDGKTYAASEGANRIEPSRDGRSLKVIWHDWGCVGSLRGKRFKTGLRSVVEFKIQENKLIRHETLTADKDVHIKEWKVALPQVVGAKIKLRADADWKIRERIFEPGNSNLGKGPLGGLPQHLIYEAADLHFKAGESQAWVLEIELNSIEEGA